MRNRVKIGAVTLIMVAAFGYLILVGHQEGTMYYFEVSEFTARAASLGSEKVRVNGEVIRRSVNYDTNSQTLTFQIKDIDGPEVLEVVYKGSPPDLLQEEGVSVVAEGRYRPEDGTFVSDKLLVKCPSKYEKKEGEA